MTSHDLAVPDESRGWQAFGEGISHHFVRAQRYEFEKDSQYEFTHIVLTNVNMTGELSAHRIFAHRNTSEVVFVQKMRKSKIG